MKTLAPCCERAKLDASVSRDDDRLVEVWMHSFNKRIRVIDADCCPWCGKRFEVVDYAAPATIATKHSANER